MNRELLHIGTCSWKYDSWCGIFYSENAHQYYLKEYATQLTTVEVDQWFWSLFPGNKVSLPKYEVVQEYASSIHKDFKFGVKVPNSITLTHHYSRDKSKPLERNPYFLSTDLFLEFLKSLEPIKPNLGPLMFQFEYLNKQKMASQTEFLKRFEKFISFCPEGYSYAVETRNPNYLNKSYFDFLKANRLYHVFLQGYYMPSVFGIYNTFKEYINDLVVIRMHGSDRKGMEDKAQNEWNKIIEAKDNELSDLAHMIQYLLDRKIHTYLYINNHYEGSAPLTIRRIMERL